MYFQWGFYLPLLLTIPIILLSLLASHKFLKNKNKSKTPQITSSQSDPPPSSSIYEVFSSFRGEDTRKSFTDFPYTYHIGANIHTFRDDNEL